MKEDFCNIDNTLNHEHQQNVIPYLNYSLGQIKIEYIHLIQKINQQLGYIFLD